MHKEDPNDSDEEGRPYDPKKDKNDSVSMFKFLIPYVEKRMTDYYNMIYKDFP